MSVNGVTRGCGAQAHNARRQLPGCNQRPPGAAPGRAAVVVTAALALLVVAVLLAPHLRGRQ